MPELKRYYIVKEHPIRIMQKCKAHAKGTFGSFLGGICILYALLNWVPELLALKFPLTYIDLLSNYRDIDMQLAQNAPSTAVVVLLYAILFSGVFKLSETLYTLTYIRNKKVDYRALTESAPYYLKTLALYVIQLLLIAFWSVFFIVPGIIVFFNFSQVFYIMADDPDKPITQILAESKIMMKGNRLSYFRLLLYYFPYIFLSYFPAYIAVAAIADASLPTAAVLAISFITDIPVFAALGYMDLGKAVFYELLINKGFADFKYAGQDSFRKLENIQS